MSVKVCPALPWMRQFWVMFSLQITHLSSLILISVLTEQNQGFNWQSDTFWEVECPGYLNVFLLLFQFIHQPPVSKVDGNQFWSHHSILVAQIGSNLCTRSVATTPGEDSMGGNWSTPKIKTGRQAMLTTAAPTTSPAVCLSKQPSKEHLLLAFFIGILLTLLLLAFVFLIIKSYRKCHSTSQVLDPHSDPPAKVSSTPDESLNYASMTFKISEEKRNHSTKHRSADLEPVVYAQVNVTNPPCLSSEA